MKTTVAITVHNEKYYCYSSKDFHGYRDFENENEARNFIVDVAKCDVKTIEQDEFSTIFYLKETEYNLRLEFFKSIMTNGFSQNQIEYWDRVEEKRNYERRASGYVIFKKFEEITGSDYVGVLDNRLIESKWNYINSGSVWGYYGHNWRQIEHDKIVNEILTSACGNNRKLWENAANWLSSSYARHWMDNRECDVDFREFSESFKRILGEVIAD